jgi:cytochrome c553
MRWSLARRATTGIALLAASTSAVAAGDRAFGEYLFSECSACHQASGKQHGGIPAIIAWPEDQFIAVMESYRDKLRENQVMQTIAARLTKDEIAALATYLGGLKPAHATPSQPGDENAKRN